METVRSTIIFFLCLTGVIFFLIGFILKITSFSLIGLGILVLNITFLFLFPDKVVREDLVHSTVMPIMYSLSAIIDYFRVKGNAIYVPPTYENKDCRLIIPKDSNIDIERLVLPQIRTNSLFFKDGIVLVPLGVNLLNLVEKEVGSSLASTELSSFTDILNKSLIEILSIAENVVVDSVGNKLFIQVFNSIFFKSCIRVHIALPNICKQVCCPLCSLIACIIAKMSGRYVKIEDSTLDAKQKSINISLRLSKII